MRGMLFVALCATLVVSGCWKSTSSSADQPRTVLEVDNQTVLDMTIYVVQTSGRRQRLGTSNAHTTQRFTIPARLVFGITALRFQADPIGSGATPVTREISVTPGDTVVWLIPPVASI